jgi:predicted nucleic acid-binding protein
MAIKSLPTLYLETSVISYLTSRPSRDLVTAAHQQITHRWWDTRRGNFRLYVSQLVENEIRNGDSNEAAKRVALIEDIESIEITEKVGMLAERFLTDKILPRKAEDDAVHIALATVRGVDFLATWNMRHMANAIIRRGIEHVCHENGFVPPVICTPEELLGEE